MTRLDPASEVVLLEASDRLGGAIRTTIRDGFLLEHGPDSFLTVKPPALDLCRELGLESELLPTREGVRRSFILREGRLYPVPEGFYLLAPGRLLPFLMSGIVSIPGKLRAAIEPLIPARRGGGDESLGAFVMRRLGREMLERVAAPMVAGIYGADPWDLSLEATLPQFLRMEREYGSVIRAIAGGSHLPGPAAVRGTSGPRYGLFLTLRGGMERLVDAIVARLPAGSVRMGAPVERIERGGAGWSVHVAGRDPIRADGVCLALPAWATVPLLLPHDGVLSDLLDGIPYGSSATVHLAYSRAAVGYPLDGMGFVAPASEGRSFLGVSFSSSKFEGRAPEGAVLLRAFVGGHGTVPHSDPGDEAPVHAVDADLRALLGIREPPLFSALHRHARSLPQYRVGHLARAEEIRRRVAAIRGLAVAGNLLGGVGVPDCIASANAAAEALH